MDIVIVAVSALVAVVLTLAIAILRVGSRYDRAPGSLSAATTAQPRERAPTRRFLRRPRFTSRAGAGAPDVDALLEVIERPPRS